MGKYKKKIKRFMELVGVRGYVLLYHPFRFRCSKCGRHRKNNSKICAYCGGKDFERYFSPHFHLIGLGWVKGEEVKKIYGKYGYVIKNINGGRRSIFRTAQYQLSHCARKKGGRAFTWVGCLSYLKFKARKFVDKGEPCPICGSIMVELKYTGNMDDPMEGLDKYKNGYLDIQDGWVPNDKVRLRGR